MGSEVASLRDVCGEVEKKEQKGKLLGGGFIWTDDDHEWAEPGEP